MQVFGIDEAHLENPERSWAGVVGTDCSQAEPLGSQPLGWVRSLWPS